ncbi:MAG: carbamoyltransferase [Actinobacteria bacterium]|nr:carbamoyltransferase [Actinomycetota bacterium]
MSQPWVLGVGASHNGGACLMHGDEIVVAIQEERLAREKRVYLHAGRPSLAVEYCLTAAGIRAEDLALAVACTQQPSTAPSNDLSRNPQLKGVPALQVPHHRGHALSAFHTSGFDESAVLVIDGLGSPWSDLDDLERSVCIGEPQGWESVSIYRGSGAALVPLEKHLAADMYLDPGGGPYVWGAASPGMPRFRTLGGLYSAVSWQLFEHGLEGPGKTMSLAGLASASFDVDQILRIGHAGPIEFLDIVPAAFPNDDRWPARESEYTALAASAQSALEHAVVSLAERALRLTGSRRLCFAGGVALNGIVNEILARRWGPENVYVIPAAEDSGTALGAAFAGLDHLAIAHRRPRISHDFRGAAYSAHAVDTAATETGVVSLARDTEPYASAAARIAGGEVVGWFDGGAEFGPRALGHRSILADPRRLENKILLNSRLKRREDFRPFAPAVLAEHASDWFEIENDPGSPFMLRVVPARPQSVELAPAIVHTDGTSRVQSVFADSNPRLYRLIEEFYALTGVPMLLNTSMNGRGEPIVERPQEAMMLALTAPLDAVYFGDLVATPRATTLRTLVPFALGEVVADDLPGTPLDAPDAGTNVAIRTPWGRVNHQVDDRALDLLRELDGRTVAALISEGVCSESDLVALQRRGLVGLSPR